MDCIITGDLNVSDVKPKVSLSSLLSSMSVSAEVDAQLTVKLLETSKGATDWLGSARDKRSVAHVSIFSAGDIFKLPGHSVTSTFIAKSCYKQVRLKISYLRRIYVFNGREFHEMFLLPY